MTLPSQINCPHCGKAYAIQPEQFGQSFQCVNCHKVFTTGAGAPVAQAYQPASYGGQVDYQSSYAAPRTSGLAIASLVCGVILCVPLIGVPAVILGALGLKKTKDSSVGGKGLAIAGLVLGIINIVGWVAYIGLIVAIMVPSLGRARETANRYKCASNMRQIGQAIMLYENENKGDYPPDLETLLKTEDITANVFNCPSTGDTPAPGADATAQANALSSGGHESYIYVGKGLNSRTANARSVILYEPMTNHGSNGCNILFGDGHVQFMTPGMAAPLITKAQAAQNAASGGN